MEFQTHNDNPNIPFGGTSLQDYIEADYRTLVTLFGEPTSSDGYKVDAEWIIQFTNGIIATIYNYKSGHNYLGAEGLGVTEITEWHVGGKTKQSFELVIEILNSQPRRYKWASPRAYFIERVKANTNAGELQKIIFDLSNLVNSDQLESLYTIQMQCDGYYDDPDSK